MGGARDRAGRGLEAPPQPPSAALLRPLFADTSQAAAAAATSTELCGPGASREPVREPPPPPWGTAFRGKTSSGSTRTSPTPIGAGRSWVRSGPRPVMCVRGLLPPGRALPAPALRACGRPGPVTSRLPPRPQLPGKGRRSRARAGRGREGTRRARLPVPAAQALPRGDAGVLVAERLRRSPFPLWALFPPPPPLFPKWARAKPDQECVRGRAWSRRIGAHTPATLTWAGACRPWPGGGGT